jgi:hypothetical protein
MPRTEFDLSEALTAGPAGRAGGWSRSICAALGWAVAGAVIAGGMWAAGLTFARSYWGAIFRPADLAGRLTAVAAALGGLSAACGFLVGGFAGLLHGLVRRERPVNRVVAGMLAGLGGAVTGVIGGGFSPLIVDAVGPAVPVEWSSALSWAAAGALAGLVGYVWPRKMPEPGEADEEEPTEDRRTRQKEWRPSPWSMSPRVVPILALSLLAPVIALVTAPPGAALAFVAVGLLGLAVTGVVAGQERRIRALERLLREREDRDDPE